MKRVLVAILLVGCGGGSKGAAPEAKTAPEEMPAAPPPGGSPTVQPTEMATPTPGPAAGGPSALPSRDQTPMPGPNAAPTPAGDGIAASGTGRAVVIAKITDAGPIGDGKCSQRSYELAVAKTISGSVPAKLWAHFEQCGARTGEPAAGNVAGTGLLTGTTYQLTLKQGASKSFGDGFMIIDARTP